MLTGDELIVAAVGDGQVSCEFSFDRHTTFYDDELDVKLHMCLADECFFRTKTTVCYHSRCHEFRFYSVTPAFLEATYYTFPPSLVEERRRTRYIQQALARKLQPATTWPRELSTELWDMVAGLLLEECAVLTAQEQMHRRNNTKDSILDLTQPIHVSYVKVDGRTYVKSLRNTAGIKTKGEISFILPSPIMQDRDVDGHKGKDIFMAEDHLGIRQIVFVSPKHRDNWCCTHPNALGAWWKHISWDDMPSTLTIRSDGLKIRNIENAHKGSPALASRIGWQVPVSAPPTVIDLLTLKTRKAYPDGLRMQFFECNAPDTIGYFVATDGARTLGILTHKQDQILDTSLFKDADAPICFWMYMPIEKGEYLTDICRRAGCLIVETETVGITFSTNRGRTAVFGLYGHENVDLWRVVTLPHSPCRAFFNQPSSSSRHAVELIALESVAVVASQDATPSLPVSVSPCPYTQYNEFWIHSSCSLRHLTLVHVCIDKSAPHRPVVGMLLHYVDGHRESVGQYRLDWSIEPITVGETDRLYICGKRTKKSWGYVATVAAGPPLNRAEGCWLDVAQTGLLEWWFSSRHSVLCYNNTRLN